MRRIGVLRKIDLFLHQTTTPAGKMMFQALDHLVGARLTRA